MQDKVPFYEKDSSYKQSGIIALVGCGLLVLAACVYWKHAYIKSLDTSYSGFTLFYLVKAGWKSMFSIDIDGNVESFKFSFRSIWPMILMLVYCITLAFLAVAGYKDNIKKVDFFVKKKKTYRLVALAIMIVLMILLTHCTIFKVTNQQYADLVGGWKSIIETSKVNQIDGSEHMKAWFMLGPGCLFFWLGIVLYFGSIAYTFVLDTLNEPDEQEKKPLPEEAETEESTESETENPDKTEDTISQQPSDPESEQVLSSGEQL